MPSRRQARRRLRRRSGLSSRCSCALLSWREDTPEFVGDSPEQERGRVVAYGTNAAVVERGKAPFGAIAHGDEGLDRIPFRRRLRLAAHDRASGRVDEGHVRARELDAQDAPCKARALEELVEESLVRCGDL